MFWGLIMEPNKRYTQIVEKAFHVSMATLDVATADDEIVQVMLCYENRNYLLCNLKSGSHWQSTLDLNFKEGTKIAFTSNGRGHVHLTGYLLLDETEDYDEVEEEEDEDEEDVPELVGKQGKRKAQTSPNDVKAISKRLKATEASIQESEENSDDDDDDDEEDDDSAAEAEDASLEMEDDSEEDEDDDEEEEEEEEEDSDEDEEDEVVDIKPQQKKNKQQPQQKQQQPQQPQQKNQKAQKQQNSLTNGKDAKSKQAVNKEEQPELNNSQAQKKKVLTGGIQIEDLKVGTGTVAKQNKFIAVYYIGRLKNGKKFDSTTNGDGFKFRLGKGEVIKGWDLGIQGMKVGGKRRITIPPAMAYGAKGSPPVIPGNSTLTFEVELKNVQ